MKTAEYKNIQLRKLPNLSVVFPSYNDAHSLPRLVKKALQILPVVAKKYEIIVVNDGSKDDTQAILDNLRKTSPLVTCISHKKNRGYGAALRSGFKRARMEYIFYTDGDGQYDVSELKKLVCFINDDCDMVSGYKIHRSDPWFRKVAGALYNNFARAIFAIHVRDIDCDFRLFRRSILRGIKLNVTSGAFDASFLRQLERKHARIQEVPVHHYLRLYGRSQMLHPAHLFRSFFDITKLVYAIIR